MLGKNIVKIYAVEIRKLIYTTNAIEGIHQQMRKFTKTKGAFTSENALFKLVYCACQKIVEKWTVPLKIGFRPFLSSMYILKEDPS
jgi:transposase-like protein